MTYYVIVVGISEIYYKVFIINMSKSVINDDSG